MAQVMQSKERRWNCRSAFMWQPTTRSQRRRPRGASIAAAGTRRRRSRRAGL